MTGLPLGDAVRQEMGGGALDRLPMFDRITPDAWSGMTGAS